MAKKKAALPKRIAGVKIPKKVRKGQLGAMLRTPLGQEVLAGVVVAATGALAANQAKRGSPARRTGAKLKAAAGGAKDAATASGSTLNYAIGEAVRSFADALRQGEPQDGEALWSSATEEMSTGKKPRLAADSMP